MRTGEAQSTHPEFLSGGGEMGSLIRRFDWANTALGPPQGWPHALKTSVSTCLNSRFAILLWWGPELIMIYNDAYAPMPGKKHPAALGRPGREVWPEIWHIIGPMLQGVMERGEATWADNLLLELERDGYPEELYFTFSYSPIRDERGNVAGVFTPVQETTGQVIGERRLRTLRHLAEAARSSNAQDTQEVCRVAAHVLAGNPQDIPFVAIYTLAEDGGAVLAGEAGLAGCPLFPAKVRAGAGAGSPFFAVTQSSEPIAVPAAGVGGLPRGAWPVPPRDVLMLPLIAGGQRIGFMFAGISPRKRLDDDYRSFLSLVGGHLCTAIAEARAFQEERRRAEALAEIDRAKTAFFSNVSHEFRTPLTLMLGPLENLLAKGDRLAPEDREKVATAHRNSRRLLSLVNSLLDFSRIEAGRMQAECRSVDLAQLTADVASNFRSVMEAGGLELIVRCPPLSRPVCADAGMWEKIVLNLLSNAFKFTFHGRVAVTLEERGDHVRLAVSDTGVGIPEAEQPRVFERFHRVEGVSGRTHEGSGIGLALLQELVKLHGGTVEVASRVGEGSVFTVTIPFGSTPPDAHVELPPAVFAAPDAIAQAFSWLDTGAHGQPHPASGRPRIVVADDNADMRAHLSRILEAQYEIVAVADGKEALAAARETRPDLILSDIMMPALDGFGLMREVRADPELQQVPVILVSARAGEEARTEGIDAGADEYLTKPFSARELTARVRTTLELQRVRREARAEFETLLNRAPLGVYLVDADFLIREVNPTARLVFGEVPGLIGRDFEEVIRTLWQPEYAEEVVRRFRRTLETGESYATEERSERRRDRGRIEYYDWRIDRIPLSDGRPGVVCYFQDISARVSAREEIAASEKRFRAFVTATSDAVYRMNADWSEMLQLRGSDFIAETEHPSRGWLEKYVHPDDRAEVLAEIAKAVRTKSVFDLEHRVIRANGALGWTLSRAIPILDAAGNVEEWIGTARDVTNRKEAETALAALRAKSEQRQRLYQTILSSTPDLVYVFGLDHRFTYANEALLRMWGKTAEEALGKTCRELGYEEWHAAMHDREIEEVVATKRPIRGLVPFTGTQGRRLYDYIFVPVLGEDGEAEAIAGTTRDVTEMHQAEEKVRDSEARLRFMAESMEQKIMTATAAGHIEYLNRQWTDFTGLALEQIRDRGWTAMVHPDDEAETRRVWLHSLETGEPFQMVHRLRRQDGAARWHLTRARPMLGVGNAVSMWIGSSTDIHEQKHNEEELRRANEYLEQFAYTATHDLQEPLRGVKIYSELLGRRAAGQLDGEALQCLEYLRSAATRMESLIKDLLSYTQVGMLDAPPEDCDAGACLAAALANLDGAISTSGARIERGRMPAVPVHPTHLQQLFQNLVGNAIKYRHPDRVPEIVVSATLAQGAWVFSVRDNGIGIGPEYRERVFGLFKRLHTGDQYGGTGIGLAICKRIVEWYHGRIWVESELGQWADFKFTLPKEPRP